MVVVVVLLCAAAVALLVWLMVGFAGDALGELSVRRPGETLGFAAVTAPPPPLVASPPPVAPPPGIATAAPASPARLLPAAPASPASLPTVVRARPAGAREPAIGASDPAAAPTVYMSPAPPPTIAPGRTVAAVVAPATSRSRGVSSVVAPATTRSQAVTPAPPVVSPPTPAPAWTATAEVGDVSPVARPRQGARAETSAAAGSAPPRRPAQEAAPRSVPENAPFVSRARRRNDSLVSRVRRRQATVAEPHEESGLPHVDEGVTVISRTYRRDRAVEPRAREAERALEPARETPETAPAWGEPRLGPTPDVRPDLGLASAARKTAVMVGSRAREALLGYPFPAADPGASAPYSGEEPAPGQTIVLVGDDVEAWVRERLYGGRLPSR